MKLSWSGSREVGSIVGVAPDVNEDFTAFSIRRDSKDPPYKLTAYPPHCWSGPELIARAGSIEELKARAQEELERRHPFEALAQASDAKLPG